MDLAPIEAGARAIRIPSQDLPISGRYDVIVAGGGPSGLGAAIAAARTGARTLLIERQSTPGGNATVGLDPVLAAPTAYFHGVARDIRDRLLSLGAADAGYVLVFDPEAFKRAALELLVEAGVEMLLYTTISDVICVDGRCTGLLVENKSGRQAFLASALVDSTGDGDLAARSGAPYAIGDAGKTRPMTLWMRLGNIDFSGLADYVWAHPDDFSRHPHRSIFDLDRGALRLFGFFSLAEQAIRAGDLDPAFNYLRLEGLTTAGGMNVNTTRVYGRSGIDGRQLSLADLEARRQVVDLLRFMRGYIPGFQRAEVMQTAATLGVRESRHPVGAYVFTEDDVVAQEVFADTVATNVQQGLPGEPMHSADGNEGGSEDTRERGTVPELVYTYNLPLRSLLPQQVEGLLLSGRAISASESGDRWTRSMPDCFSTGQAAGVTAALAAALGTVPREVPVNRIQAELRRQGVRIELEALPKPFLSLPDVARTVHQTPAK